MSKQVGNVALMQKMNRLRVLNFIRKNPDVSRPVIAEKTGLSLASLTNITTYLMDEGLLVESGIELADRVGRKSTLLRFAKDRWGIVLVALSDSSASVFYTNLEGEISLQLRYTTQNFTYEQVISLLLEKVNFLLAKYGRENTVALGITFSGLVLDGNRFVLSSSMKWTELDIKKIFEKNTSLPVFVENISIIRAVSYSSKASDNRSSNTVFVDLENGVGAVLLYDGSVVHNVLGEIGHTTVEKDGLTCFCGNRGCLEAMCSKTRLIQLFNEKSDIPAETLEQISALYDDNNPHAVYAVDECATYLSMGLANLVMLFGPKLIVLNKGQFSMCEQVINKAICGMKQRIYHALVNELDVCMIDVKQDDMVRGAAFEICDRLFDISFENNPIQ